MLPFSQVKFSSIGRSSAIFSMDAKDCRCPNTFLDSLDELRIVLDRVCMVFAWTISGPDINQKVSINPFPWENDTFTLRT